MYLLSYELDGDVDFVRIVVEMASFRVTVVCFLNDSIRSSSCNVKYVRGRHKLFACNSNMNLNEFVGTLSTELRL